MQENGPSYHVGPAGDRWEVERETGEPVFMALTREEAVQAAVLASREDPAPIVVHAADGAVEEMIEPEDLPQSGSIGES